LGERVGLPSYLDKRFFGTQRDESRLSRPVRCGAEKAGLFRCEVCVIRFRSRDWRLARSLPSHSRPICGRSAEL
jgi:hypothetical protein